MPEDPHLAMQVAVDTEGADSLVSAMAEVDALQGVLPWLGLDRIRENIRNALHRLIIVSFEED